MSLHDLHPVIYLYIDTLDITSMHCNTKLQSLQVTMAVFLLASANNLSWKGLIIIYLSIRGVFIMNMKNIYMEHACCYLYINGLITT